MSTVRREKGSNFTPISRALLQDNSLSFEARGLMGYLLSKPDDWEAQFHDIEREGNIGRDKRKSLMAELERAGYLERRRLQGERGQWDYEMIVHETPLPEAERTSLSRPPTPNPATVNPQTVEPSTVRPQTVKAAIIEKREVPNRDLQKKEAAAANADAEMLRAVLAACALPSTPGEATLNQARTAALKLITSGATPASVEAYALSRTDSIPKLKFLHDDWTAWNAQQSRRVLQMPVRREFCGECRQGWRRVEVNGKEYGQRCACNPEQQRRAS